MRVHRSLLCRAVGALVVCAFLSAAASADPIQLPSDFVVVGNPGNPGTPASIDPNQIDFGAVGYEYGIGQFEVTAGQYTAFLNAVAASDPHGLYNANMDGVEGSGITQTIASGNYQYTVASNYASRPVNWVSWYDAARYANWRTTGDSESGAYLFDGNGDFLGINRALGMTLNQDDIAYVLPTEDEWYKAAYYDPTLNGGAGSYWIYPTQSNSDPGQDLTETTDPGNNANYFNAVGGSPYTSLVGEFELSDSYYETFDQGGNVTEWNESPIVTGRGFRGGSFDTGVIQLQLLQRQYDDPNYEGRDRGFRLGAFYVPEPGSAMMLLFGALAGLLWRRRRG